jgi:hypothetical protein
MVLRQVNKGKSFMEYTLITSDGKIMLFYLKPVAEMYQTIYGGSVIYNKVFEETKEVIYYDETCS